MYLSPIFIQNLQKFRVVTFDITDTILAFKKPVPLQYIETAANHGYTLNKERLMQSFPTEFKTHAKLYPNFGLKTNMDWRQWWIKLVMNVFNSIDARIPKNDAQVIAEELIRIYRTDYCWKILDGATEIIKKMKESDKIVGVISNFDCSLPQLLRAMNLTDFDFVLTSYDCVPKPDKRIFDMAVAKCEVQPHHALHIGNLYNVDYLGAKNAGWSSVLISKMSDEQLKKEKLDKNHVYPTLPDLIKALEMKIIEL